MIALVFTAESIARLHRFGIDDEWFSGFEIPAGNHGLKRFEKSGIVFIIEDDLESDNVPLVVINLSDEYRIFDENLPNAMALDRIIVASSMFFDAASQIPSTWKPYSVGDVISFYAGNVHKGKGARIHLRKKPNNSGDLFVFARTERTIEFDEIVNEKNIHRRVRSSFVDAILADSEPVLEASTAGIVLTERLPFGFTQGANLDEWYDKRLTQEQRRFVDLSYEGPVRLKGSAGTGKTLALVVKILRDGLKFGSDPEKKWRLCFVAHSQSSIELVISLCQEFLSPRVWKKFVSGNNRIEIRTLYDLANHHLNFPLRDLTPISLDGVEGRHFQYELIESALKSAYISPIVRARHSDIDVSLKMKWKNTVNGVDKFFIAELMSEFSSVIDAENIRKGEESGDKYINKANRPNWLLLLRSKDDRRFVLDIHSIYRSELSDMNALSIDEMIADFSSFLDSHAWDRERRREGYDAVFVDELHLFTALEKQTLQKLVKPEYDGESRPKRPNVFMAYDLKQSPRDSFIDYFAADRTIFSPKSGLQNSELVQLDKVFRYTPQIAEFLKDLDSAFPAIDIPGEWGAYIGHAELPDDAAPTLLQCRTSIDILEVSFKEAGKCARKLSGGGRRVAVLCVSEEMFEKYLVPVSGRFKTDAYPVTNRESTSQLRHLGRRFIFSMPEYVAGLQFDTVFLLHLDQSEAPSDAGIGRRRQLISNAYLGASRAENTLRIFSCEERGGISDILRLALDRGSLLET